MPAVRFWSFCEASALDLLWHKELGTKNQGIGQMLPTWSDQNWQTSYVYERKSGKPLRARHTKLGGDETYHWLGESFLSYKGPNSQICPTWLGEGPNGVLATWKNGQHTGLWRGTKPLNFLFCIFAMVNNRASQQIWYCKPYPKHPVQYYSQNEVGTTQSSWCDDGVPKPSKQQ